MCRCCWREYSLRAPTASPISHRRAVPPEPVQAFASGESRSAKRPGSTMRTLAPTTSNEYLERHYERLVLNGGYCQIKSWLRNYVTPLLECGGLAPLCLAPAQRQRSTAPERHLS